MINKWTIKINALALGAIFLVSMITSVILYKQVLPVEIEKKQIELKQRLAEMERREALLSQQLERQVQRQQEQMRQIQREMPEKQLEMELKHLKKQRPQLQMQQKQIELEQALLEAHRREKQLLQQLEQMQTQRQTTLRFGVDKIMEEMDFGHIAFNVPTNINIDDFAQIHLSLSLAEAEEKLKQAIIEEGEKLSATIRVSDRMEARLSGHMFQITAITPEIQVISKSKRTDWKWEMFPKEEGKHKIHLTLTALLEINGHSTPRTIRTFEKVIEVNVKASQKIELFAKKNWQWLWAAILLPIIGWLWRVKKMGANRVLTPV